MDRKQKTEGEVSRAELAARAQPKEDRYTWYDRLDDEFAERWVVLLVLFVGLLFVTGALPGLFK